MSVVTFVRPPDGLRAIAIRELASHAYRWTAPAPAQRSWWQRITEWIGDRWNDIVQVVFGRVHGGAAPSIAGDILLALAVLVVIVFALKLLSSMSLDRERESGAEPLYGNVRSTEWYRRAVESASNGDFAYASRYLMGATVAALRERSAIEPSAGATVGELGRELFVRAPQYVTPFRTVARTFAIGTYAERPLGRADFDGAAGAYRAICEQT
ncbi:MAG TPA: hypothetical protein VN936_10840 [Candidatus Acidoferrum sp.]|nr:hypothetical protein [Candidatus Acidoferrum sp.]